MPLMNGTSKNSFTHNIKAEVGAGKPVNQALAIAYAKKRDAMRRRQMWEGGKVCMSEGGVVGEDFRDDGGDPGSAATEDTEEERESIQAPEKMAPPDEHPMDESDYRAYHATVRPSTTDDIRPPPHEVSMETFGPAAKEQYDESDEMAIARALKKRRYF